MTKIQLCSGNSKLEGWDNFDKEVDISKPLAFTNDYADFVFVEHGIEHITQRDAFSFLCECYRVLKQDGVLRIAYPDIGSIFGANNSVYNAYATQYSKVKSDDPTSIKSALQSQLFGWGHKAVWTRQLMFIYLDSIGFKRVAFLKRRESSHVELRNLERHGTISETINNIETVVVEATKYGLPSNTR